MSETNTPLNTGAGVIGEATYKDAAGNSVFGHVLLTGTTPAPVAPGNALLVSDAAAEANLATVAAQTAGLATSANQTSLVTQTTAAATALGTPADVAWTGTGNAGAVALLKGLYAKISTTLIISGSVAVSALPGSPAQDGTDATGVTLPAGATGIRGWLSGIYNRLAGTLTVTVSALPGSIAQDGTDATGVTAPAGAVGIRGWLSGIYSRLAGTLAVSVSTLPGSPAQDGTDATGVLVPTGGIGIRGWLSGIYLKLSGTISTTVSNFPGSVQTTGGTATALGLTAATVVKATPGRSFRINVLVAGTTAGTLNDVATTAAAAVANQVAAIPFAVGTYDMNAPHAAGIVFVPGTGMTASVIYS